MKITYESATMQFSIEVVGNQLKLTLYKQPDKIQRGGSFHTRRRGLHLSHHKRCRLLIYLIKTTQQSIF